MADKRIGKKRPVGRDRVIFDILSHIILLILSALCLLPFLLVLSGSFSRQEDILTKGYRLIPVHVTTDAYKMLFRIPEELIRAYGVTILVTVVGTRFGLWFTSMAAYVISSKDFRYRYQVSFFFYFTSIFVNVTYLLILKSYMMNIPDSLYESARLDGAGDFTIYWNIVIPLSKSGLATVGLFIALAYWNDWYNAMLYMDEGSRNLYPLQYFLNNILTKAQAMNAAAARSGIPASDVPGEPMKLAMTVVATGPIVLLYPFLQRYFVKGVTIGAVKG